MPNAKDSTPRHYPGVMVSSTFTDLEQHRAALIKAIRGQGLADVAMENDSAKPDVDVIDSSLQMVRDASAYIGVISFKYGQTPQCPNRNPRGLSITELEFNEAQLLNRPILLFIMGEKHYVLPADVESDPAKKDKLNAFRERAKQLKPDSPVHRVYCTFHSLEEFARQATQSVADLRRHLDEKTAASITPPIPVPTPPYTTAEPDPIPTPPAFYAEPRYIGSHRFVGRQAQLDVLDDWAVPADPHPVLLFEAIGGAGKSMLTWEWTTTHAAGVRGDWAGRFWYSFYERGAIMADFCGRALAYITGKQFDDFRRKKTPVLAEQLLHHLQARPWLLVLDGLERVLVHYHRFDAASLPDEAADRPTDQIAHRDPCAAIRPEDDDLLRALAAAAPSKLLITSRLVPRVLLNAASQPIPGVLRVSLPGLRPSDAEALLRSCGVIGGSQAIQDYLKSHCDCHPLVTGVLAGLVNDYLPDRGNFDAWAADSAGGGRLNLADLDLVQKRNHILQAALDALPEKSRQLLSTLALLSEAVDYPTLSALNPHLPTPQELSTTVRDIERRGLLQYDGQHKRYDLHPVVRGIAAGGLRPEEIDRYGQRVVDHFSRQPHGPYEQAETLEDLRNALQVVRTLLNMGRYQRACDAYTGDMASALLANLEAYPETLSLLRPFFPRGWASLPNSVDKRARSNLAHNVAVALSFSDEPQKALAAHGASLLTDLGAADWAGVVAKLTGISMTLSTQNRLASAERCLLLALDLAGLTDDEGHLFRALLDRFRQLVHIGQWVDAEALWQLLDPMGREWSRDIYRPGYAEYGHALFRFWQGQLKEEDLAHAEQLAKKGKNRGAIRYLHGLRGLWQLEQGQWAIAAESLHEAVRMARAVGKIDTAAETQLALARFRLGQLSDPRREAEQLANARRPAHRALAELWLAIGDRVQAKQHALAAYTWAWADGKPYVHRYELNKATALLKQLGVEIPNLPPYDPARDEKFPWEDEVAAAIEKLRGEKEEEKRKEEPEKSKRESGNREKG